MSHDQSVVRNLPSNLHSTFRSILKNYDNGLYKKAIKAADSILKTHPTHGETLSLKGLSLFHSGDAKKKKEAWLLARQGAQYDIRSFVCWHVLAILYRSERMYIDAAKALAHAYAYQPTNAQVMRDLAQLHAYNRNYEENLRLRQLYLNENSKGLTSWTGFVAALHLNGEVDRAFITLDSFLKATPDSFKDPADSTEIYLYKNQLLEETGNLQGALEQLDQDAAKIFDKEGLQSRKAEFLRRLNRLDEAETILRGLIKVNPENFTYYQSLLVVVKALPENIKSLRESTKLEAPSKLLAVCDELAKLYPKARAPLMIPLSFVSGEEFRTRFARSLVEPLTKGTPSLFASIKYLYADAEKVKIAGQVVSEMEKSVVSTKKLSKEEAKEEPPSTIIWIRYYLAQHASFVGEPLRALALLDECIEHTPTCIEFEVMKARVYKDHGDVDQAVAHIEEARSMDLADRYLNNKNTRYLLRAGKVEEARKLISIYTKAIPEDMATEYGNVYDLQVNWYAIEEGDAWRKLGNLPMALKKFSEVDEHFTQYRSDEFDYHAYCLRKNTLRQYMQLVKMEDQIRDHSFWFKAATRLVETYLEFIDRPHSASGATVDKELEGLSEQERKKVLAKRRKDAARKEREEEEKKKNAPAASSKKRQGHFDADPAAEHFMDDKNALAEADKYAKQLVQYCDSKIESHLLAFEVQFRREKYLLALKALKRSIQLATVNDARVHQSIVKLAKRVSLSTVQAALNEHVKAILNEELKALQGDAKDWREYNKAFLARNKPKIAARVAFAAAELILESPALSAKELEQLLVEDLATATATYMDAIKAHEFALEQKQEAVAASLKKAASVRFPTASYFKEAAVSAPAQ